MAKIDFSDEELYYKYTECAICDGKLIPDDEIVILDPCVIIEHEDTWTIESSEGKFTANIHLKCLNKYLED